MASRAIALALPQKSNTIRIRFSRLELGNPFRMVQFARKGVKPELFYQFAESIKMPEKILSGILNIHSRTIGNYMEGKKTLQPAQGEHLLKLIALFEKGEELFGNVDEFNYWLKKPFWNAKEKPIDWLETPGGVDLVTDELSRLAYGDVI